MFEKLKDIVEYCDQSDPEMPGGKAVDDPTGDSYAGTSWDAVFFNQILGFFMAAITDGLGGMDKVSGSHDTAKNSDVLNALKKTMKRIVDGDVTPEMILNRIKKVHGIGSGLDADLFGSRPPSFYLNQGIMFFVKPVSGVEAVIPNSELGIQFNPEKQYAVFVSAAGNYPEYVSFNAEILPDGLHVRPMRLVGGKLVPGTPMQAWGTKKWGAGIASVPGKKWGDGKWGNGTWSTSRTVGGDTWGGFGPMNINIIIKEA